MSSKTGLLERAGNWVKAMLAAWGVAAFEKGALRPEPGTRVANRTREWHHGKSIGDNEVPTYGLHFGVPPEGASSKGLLSNLVKAVILEPFNFVRGFINGRIHGRMDDLTDRIGRGEKVKKVKEGPRSWSPGGR